MYLLFYVYGGAPLASRREARTRGRPLTRGVLGPTSTLNLLTNIAPH